jgi:hypothetical protein
VETLVLVLQIVLDVELGVFLQRLGLVEIAWFFVPFDWNLGISGVIDNPHDVPIGLRISCHEAFEEWFRHSILSH